MPKLNYYQGHSILFSNMTLKGQLLEIKKDFIIIPDGNHTKYKLDEFGVLRIEIQNWTKVDPSTIKKVKFKK